MMRFVPWLWMGLLFPFVPGATLHDTSPHACECEEVLAFVSDYVERNYAGFPDKASGADRQRYEEHRARLRARAGGAPTESECHALLLEYVGFFEDPHLGLSYQAASNDGPTEDEEIRARFADRPVRPVSEAEVRDQLDRSGDDLSPIEGIWEVVGADYRVAVLPEEGGDGGYEAVVLRADSVWWVPGQIKATFERTAAGEFRADHYMRDHSLREETARLRQGLLVFTGVSSWARVYPDNVSGYDRARYRDLETNGEFAVRSLDENTVLVNLPDFAPALQAQIDSMIEANWDRLTSARDLIVDVRRNPGGSNASFHSVLPLLYTGPIVTPGISHYATDDNIRAIETFLEEVDVTEEVAGEVRTIITGMREHRGGFVPTPDDTLTLDAVPPRPERVAILADRWCVSSCESLVWAALQSDKATVFGENTGGFLDYGDQVPVDTSCPAFRLYLPTGRSNRIPQGIPLDNVGIEPDVRVPEDVVYWVDWVRERPR